MKKLRWLGILLALSVFVLPADRAYAAEEIQIDGYYADWEMIPKATMSYGSHNGKEAHEGAVVMGDEYLYVYVRISDLYQSQIPVNNYSLTVNDKTIVLDILGKDREGRVDYSYGVYQMSNGTHIYELGLFPQGNASFSVGDVAVTIANGNPNDTLEFRIKLSVLEELYGFDKGVIKNGASISFRNPNLGAQSISLVGASSGAILGAVLCVASVGGALFFYKKRKQRVQ